MTITTSESPATASEVILGIDTHLDVHVAVALDGLGRRLGQLNVPTTVKGYHKLLHWAEGFGPVCCAGVEGTGSYGAGLARYLKAAGISVMEVERPKRRHLRRKGKGRTRSMRRLLLGRSWPTTRPEYPRAVMVRWRDPDTQIGPSIGTEGPYTGRKPTPGSAGYRTGGPTPPSARAPYQESG